MTLGIVLTIVSVLLVIGIGLYLAYVFNRLYRYKNAAEANIGQIQVAMKKRLDMINQLLGSVKSYIKYERDVFQDVTRLRSRVMKSEPGELEELDRKSRSIFSAIRAVAERYPDLKANETVMKMMDAIVSVEDEIARHRYTYNNIVQEFNTMVDTIPSNMVAKSVGMEKLEYLEFEEEVEQAPILKDIAKDE
ncbi:MAG: LemA family protein [Thermoproteota archaeon]